MERVSERIMEENQRMFTGRTMLMSFRKIVEQRDVHFMLSLYQIPVFDINDSFTFRIITGVFGSLTYNENVIYISAANSVPFWGKIFHASLPGNTVC